VDYAPWSGDKAEFDQVAQARAWVAAAKADTAIFSISD